MAVPVRVLIVEDSEDDAFLVLGELRRGGYEPEHERVDTREAMAAALARQAWDIVISDHAMPRFSSMAALTLVKDQGLDLPFIIVSGVIGEEAAVSAMKAGAHDYVMKGRLSRLVPAVERETREAVGRQERREAEAALRESEARLRHSQKMEAIGRLAGGVAHDFNNLLTVIQGFSDLILHRLEPEDAERGPLEEIRKAAARAATLTRQLLVFSRQDVVQPRVIDLNAVVTEMDKMLRRLIGEDIEFVTTLGQNPGRVLMDPGHLEQVIMNLVVNARDAMPQGGRLVIETAGFELEESPAVVRPGLRPGRYVVLAVSDTGVGMDADTRARIFEPFFTTKESGKGTGLGLATVHGIVKQCAGDVQVHSEPGHGATFKIYLPGVEQAAGPADPERRRGTLPKGNETVLLVEDEDGVRRLVHSTLTSLGYTVLQAQHGPEALVVSERHAGSIEILLTDMVMPQMSGPELVSRLTRGRPGIRVLYMSGYVEQAVVRQGLLDPRVAFLGKPFGTEALARKVRDVLDELDRKAA